MFMCNGNRMGAVLSAVALTGFLAAPASAESIDYDGITFPEGDISFADQVISYDPAFSGGNVPTDSDYTDPSTALGAPDYDSPTGSVSLGSGGRIILRFTDNALTGSGTSDADLHIFEIGPDVEDTFVDISKNGTDFFNVGKVFGDTDSIDIDDYFDDYGFGVEDEFFYVRLTDDSGEGNTTGTTVGADIDAVGAISTTPHVIPLPAASSMGIIGFAMLGLRRGKRRRSAHA